MLYRRLLTKVVEAAGVHGQYLSDIKRDKRPMTELVARRLADAFGLNHQWLLGLSDVRELGSLSESDSYDASDGLPVLNHPVEGDPRQTAAWDSSTRGLPGVADDRLIRTSCDSGTTTSRDGYARTIFS